jgi:hypothetical protein
MQRHCRVEIARPLPAGLRDELDRRFGPLQIRDEPDGIVLRGLTVDQAGLRALLGLLWDAGVQVNAVSTTRSGGGRTAPSLDPG